MAQISISLADLKNQTKLSEEKILSTLPTLGVPVEESSEAGELSLEITPNRPDLLSVEGIARLLNSYCNGKRKQYAVEGTAAGELIISPSVKKIRPFIAMARADGITLDDYSIKSIMQIQEKLHDTLGRKRKKVAIGIHNADVVALPFKYSAYSPEEISFVPLDMQVQMTCSEILRSHPKGIDYAHLVKGKCPIISDKNNNVLSFPPIINGELTRVTEDTSNLLIDVTGTSKEAVEITLNILCCMLSDREAKIRGMRIGGTEYPDLSLKKMKFSKKKCEKLLGIALSDSQAKTCLEKMGFEVESPSSVLIPPYRADIMHEVDLYEDAAIAYGYGNIIPSLPNLPTIGDSTPSHPAHEILVGSGFLEASGWLLTNEEEQKRANILPAGVKIKNPLTEDFTQFRTSLTPSILRIFSESRNEKLPQKIYEIGAVSLPQEKEKLCAAIYSPDASFSKIKSVLEMLMKETGKICSLEREANPSFIKGRCAVVNIDGKHIGVIGEIHPQVLENFSLEQPVALFEIDAKM
ncbi:phenylalanine--tRNA ligase subunit beta [Candidatus Micrarchaeota archaeon CG1_02_47_40]|nr:MAG: phenylalanine--tRNA ligase subunit beta [Candidatus Micrarchaeota archaeon CG1_02_47_40]